MEAPGGIPIGTIRPDDPDLMEAVEEALVGYGFIGFKFHINVQRFFPDDPRVLSVSERVFGSEFPNLPYPYEEEREALWLRDLPLAAFQKIFHDNAAALLGLA